MLYGISQVLLLSIFRRVVAIQQLHFLWPTIQVQPLCHLAHRPIPLEDMETPFSLLLASSFSQSLFYMFVKRPWLGNYHHSLPSSLNHLKWLDLHIPAWKRTGECLHQASTVYSTAQLLVWFWPVNCTRVSDPILTIIWPSRTRK